MNSGEPLDTSFASNTSNAQSSMRSSIRSMRTARFVSCRIFNMTANRVLPEGDIGSMGTSDGVEAFVRCTRSIF